MPSWRGAIASGERDLNAELEAGAGIEVHWRVVLRDAQSGPFEAAVTSIRSPAWMAGAPPADTLTAVSDAGALTFVAGETAFVTAASGWNEKYCFLLEEGKFRIVQRVR